MLLDHNKFVLKMQKKGFSGKKSFEILDAESGDLLGTAVETTKFLASLLGAMVYEVRDAEDNAPLFTVGRTGLILKKDQVLSPKGELIGRYKAKVFSLSGGFHVYDKDGKHLAEMQGKMFKSEYKFLAPDKGGEMGSVSRTWGGLAKSLLSGGSTFGVQIDPKFAKNQTAKMLILGATIAVETIFRKAAGAAGKESDDEGGGGSGGGSDD